MSVYIYVSLKFLLPTINKFIIRYNAHDTQGVCEVCEVCVFNVKKIQKTISLVESLNN